MRIYLDHASTTPLDPRVLETMLEVMRGDYGNPSSIHYHGRKCRAVVEEARKEVAQLIGASTGEVFFTSCATEANNMALIGAVKDLGVERIISSPIEHHCVLHTLDHIRAHYKTDIQYLPVDAQGNVDLDELEGRLSASDEKTLVSLMHANNEIGTVLDLDRVSACCEEHGALFHCDTVQSLTKFELDLSKTRMSFIAGSAHKFYGPKGIGFIYINADNMIQPLIHGGSQERKMRAGTENVYGIVGLAKAMRLAIDESEQRHEHVSDLRAYLKRRLQTEFDDIAFNGDQTDRHLYNVLSVSFPPSPKANMLMLNLDIAGISASSGSACSSGAENASHVLTAIGADHSRKTVRFSFSHHNTRAEIDYLVDKLKTMTPVKHTARIIS